MKDSPNTHRVVGVVLFLMVACVPRLGSAAAATDPAEPPPGAPKSVFNSQPNFGKDPFFPYSKRRERVKVVPREPETQAAKSGVPPWVTAKGLSVLKDRKLAIINNYTVGEGEEFTLKGPGGQSRKFKCIEIKESGVVVGADGVTKELPFRPGL